MPLGVNFIFRLSVKTSRIILFDTGYPSSVSELDGK
jgi:hypothetical protein